MSDLEPTLSRRRWLPTFRYRWIELKPPRLPRGYLLVKLFRSVRLERRIVWPWQPIRCFDLTRRQAFKRPARSNWETPATDLCA